LLLHQSLPGGVRLRLPHRADADGLRALCERHRADCDPDRLLHFDPRERAVICATAGIGAAETVVGVGAIRLCRGAEPELLLADDEAVAAALRATLAARVVSRPPAVRPRGHGRRLMRAMVRRPSRT
jgi:hypothetical protein